MFFHWSKFKAHSFDIFFSGTFDLLFINSNIYIYCLEFISHHMKEIFRQIQTPKETNHKIKAKRYIFSLVSDIDVEKSCFYVELKSFINNF